MIIVHPDGQLTPQTFSELRDRPKKILIVTGEASGDQLGAALITSLRQMEPAASILAVGGSLMRATYPELFLSSGDTHATGFTEVLRHLPAYFKLFKRILRLTHIVRPDLIVLVDNPGFNLRLAKKLKALGIPVVGYVSPQVWAWKEGRTRLMSQVYRKVLTLFDFEESFLEARGVRAKWVGHPIVDIWPVPVERTNTSVNRIVLLPGSRPHEVRSLLPVMLEAAARIAQAHSGIRWSLLEADTLPKEFYDPLLLKSGLTVERYRGNKQELFWKSDLAFACSGTVTLECALAALPTVIGYRVSAFTAFIARLLVKVKFLGMPNILAGKEIMPELIQESFTAENLERAALDFIQNPNQLTQSRSALTSTRSHLGPPGSPGRAAQEILKHLS
jgi:lipid-A-disaccharide synthase